MRDENALPEKLEAYEAELTCGSRVIGTSILMVADGDTNNPLCHLDAGTVREKKIALLWQASPRLLTWAIEACETTREFVDAGEDRDAPSWLAELEAAVRYAEEGELL